MVKYDGLIIPRSYSDYLNKTDGATLSQMLDSIGGTFDAVPTPNSNKPARSGGIFTAAKMLVTTTKNITGAAISAGSIVRVYFNAYIMGTDNTTALVLKYNGVDITVKIKNNGSLIDFVAYGTSFVYCQRYTTLNLYYDGTNFIIIGNPLVYSDNDVLVYANGQVIYRNTGILYTATFTGQSTPNWGNLSGQITLSKGTWIVTFYGNTTDDNAETYLNTTLFPNWVGFKNFSNNNVASIWSSIVDLTASKVLTISAYSAVAADLSITVTAVRIK